jgi:hypothetical protein
MPRGPSYDQDPDLGPRGNNYPDPADQPPISGEDCLQFIKLYLAKLTGPDRDDLLAGLTNLLSTEEGAQDGIVAANQGALDRMRSGNRRPAQDAQIQALNARAWARRFPFVDVKFGGTGR